MLILLTLLKGPRGPERNLQKKNEYTNTIEMTFPNVLNSVPFYHRFYGIEMISSRPGRTQLE